MRKNWSIRAIPQKVRGSRRLPEREGKYFVTLAQVSGKN